MSRQVAGRVAVAALVLLALAAPTRAHAHCDTMDGPVVVAALRALETGSVEYALVWVQEDDEAEVRRAFDHVRRVRAAGGDAATLADRFFLETVVRLHRQGEGEPYTGLKPAGSGITQAVAHADAALESGSAEELRHLLHALLDARLDGVFADAVGRRRGVERLVSTGGAAVAAPHDRGAAHAEGTAPAQLAAGRAYVEAYVQLLHLVEALETVLSGHGHHVTPAPTPAAAATHSH